MENQNLTLQYQMCNGMWEDCGERTERFLRLCEEFNGIDASGQMTPRFRAIRAPSRDEVVSTLLAGKELRNDAADWYSNCRNKPAPRPPRPVVPEVRCACGHMVPANLVMSTSLGTSCPDCYDRMSN